jgi:hypothetical protein
MMVRIVVEAESNMGEFTQPPRRRDRHGLSVAETICESVLRQWAALRITCFWIWVWSDITPVSCRFEQAFSDDGGKTWEVNWVNTYRRVGNESDQSH